MKTCIIATTLVASCFGGSASAGVWAPGNSIDIQYMGTSPRAILRYDFDASRAYNQASTAVGTTAAAGQTTFRVMDANGADSGARLYGFCVEVGEDANAINTNETYTFEELTAVPEDSPPGPMSAMRASVMEDLYARYFYSTTQGSDADTFAAFQLAIWEVSHENSGSAGDAGVSASSFIDKLFIEQGAMDITDADSNVVSIAQAMLNALGTGGLQGMSGLYGISNPNFQDFLVVVPSPAIAGLAGLGLVGMRRRRR